VVACGQQCSPSLQQTASGSGQQPQSPVDSLQQVVPAGQLWVGSHFTGFEMIVARAGNFVNHRTLRTPIRSKKRKRTVSRPKAREHYTRKHNGIQTYRKEKNLSTSPIISLPVFF